jgi:excisionase family DNA binding protein
MTTRTKKRAGASASASAASVAPAPAHQTDQLVYTADEARRMLRIGTAMMTRLLCSGELPSIRLGSRRRLITRQALLDFLARMEAASRGDTDAA